MLLVVWINGKRPLVIEDNIDVKLFCQYLFKLTR
jgi:hypothetical protein